MTQKKTIAIISNNDMGLILASQLQHDGHHVTLIDTDDSFSLHTISHRELPFYPDTVEARAALISLNSLLVDPVHYEALVTEPCTYEDAQWRPFLGFGDNKNATVATLSLYNVHSRLQLSRPLESCMQKLREGLKCKVLKFSELTKFEIVGNSAEKLIINGNQEIFADQFVFNLTPNELVPLIQTDHIPSRMRSRIAKTPLWARITLELTHNVQLLLPMHLAVLAANQADGPILVGLEADRTNTALTPTYSSIWECYVDNQLIEDADYLSNMIKGMRKLIRRACPQAEIQTHEILMVTPAAAADYSWLGERAEHAQPLENIILFPPMNSHANGLAARVIGAHTLYERIKETLSVSTFAGPSTAPSMLNTDATEISTPLA